MPTTGPAPQRKMRADARRNYERLLAAAKDVFAEHGVEASLEEIARRAGVANGTLYSHFPTRQALLEALLRDRMQALSDTARELLDLPSADEALTGWARAAMAHATVYRGLAVSLMSSIQDETSHLHAACQAVLAGGQRILDRAQASGVVRGDVTASDVYALVNAAAWAGEQTSRAQAERLLSFGLEGMRPPVGG
ncbi:TetR/AcrR family transcriptional regulator [Nonomuraea jiangxiensis]|uniref:DNA-binding transcriptional regulator, AcrR family n=1 Tax=Nonomuraea jiangxiensis TaxID=633440 RepID=A0A1G9G4T5_9ACTN|nr:TetR/AcrR family transcriptional regulator [Nonomuraea jiangxiensis]SDK95607.1 DNA-binding transcriptional regulator, AcrR family [Nonomuraea jiangxiensis]